MREAPWCCARWSTVHRKKHESNGLPDAQGNSVWSPPPLRPETDAISARRCAQMCHRRAARDGKLDRRSPQLNAKLPGAPPLAKIAKNSKRNAKRIEAW